MQKREYVYFLVNRPPDIGTYPTIPQPIEVRDYPTRTFVSSVNRFAWGYVKYNVPLTEQQISDYELVSY